MCFSLPERATVSAARDRTSTKLQSMCAPPQVPIGPNGIPSGVRASYNSGLVKQREPPTVAPNTRGLTVAARRDPLASDSDDEPA
eukprot:1046622-Prorocentrum_minimum.AAC.1